MGQLLIVVEREKHDEMRGGWMHAHPLGRTRHKALCSHHRNLFRSLVKDSKDIGVRRSRCHNFRKLLASDLMQRQSYQAKTVLQQKGARKKTS